MSTTTCLIIMAGCLILSAYFSASAYQIGPAYFLKLDKEHYNGDFTALWDMHIEVLLKEYLRGYSNAEAKVEEFKNVYFDSLNNETVDVVD